jgi:transposase
MNMQHSTPSPPGSLRPASICEATGARSSPSRRAHAPGASSTAADARKIESFIRSLGTLGKTDTIDARGLARCGAGRHDRLPLWQPREAIRDELHGIGDEARDIVAARLAYANRLGAPGGAPVAARLRRLHATLAPRSPALKLTCTRLIASNAPLERAAKKLQSIAGIGATTAIVLLALMPELETPTA